MGLAAAPVSAAANILVAASPAGFGLLESLLEGYALLPAYTIDDALDALQRRQDIALVICAVMFDESRMFEFLRAATARHARIPVICVRAAQSDLLRSSLDSLEEVTRRAGAKAFLDVLSLSRMRGVEHARTALQSCLREHLGTTAR